MCPTSTGKPSGSALVCHPNRKARSLTSSAPTPMFSRGSPWICRAYREKSPEHSLNIKSGSRPVKQHLWRFDKAKCRTIGEEIAKLKAAGFIKEVY